MVLFPHVTTPVFVVRGRALATVESLAPAATRLFLVAQRDIHEEDPEIEGLHQVGTEAEILQILRLSDGTIKVLVEGIGRCLVREYYFEDDTLWAEVLPGEEPGEETPDLMARGRGLLSRFEDYLRVNQRLPHELYAAVESLESSSAIADAIAANIPIKLSEKQSVLETIDPVERIDLISSYIDREIDLLKVERKVRSRARRQMNRNQKEFYLTEQLRAIQKELGHGDGMMGDTEELRQRVKDSRFPKEVAEKLDKEIGRLEMMTALSPEASVARTYVEWLLDVPWTEKTRERNDLKGAWEILESEHFGLKKVKERILEHLAVKVLNKAIRGPILCFVGPPGVGKTSLGRSVANAMGRKFVRVSLGGVRDEAEIRGHRRTYIGALPGRIIQSMKKVGARNPVFLLDEIDKMNVDFRGDPSAALLEALDPEQNKSFNDHYLEVDFDLSQVFFITTANSTDAISPALLDRMEVIRLPGYTDEEKLQIAKNFLIPKQREEHGLGKDRIQILDAAIFRLINEYTRESGVRNLERELGSLCRKVARKLVEKGQKAKAKKTGSRVSAKKSGIKTARVTAESLEKYLGAPRYTPDQPETRAGVGVATGLAWTPMGGVLLPVEVSVFAGKGNLLLTGKLGDVMKESARAAISWLRSRTKELGIPSNFFEKRDMHIHFPEGAIPKDGPSAGITMGVALASALSGRKVRHDVAMTGEVTLRGRVLPIGGVKEKLLAARRGGIPVVLLPRENEKDVIEVEAETPLGLEIHYVGTMEEVVEKTLLEKPRKKSAPASKGARKLRAAPAPVAPKRRPGVPKSPAVSGKKRGGALARGKRR
jgi:ATP-dependent Lon protease